MFGDEDMRADEARAEAPRAGAAEHLAHAIALLRRDPCGHATAALVELEAVARELPALVADARCLDVLEREAHIEPLVLHDGRQDSIGGLRGLGLMPGRLRRSLRDAIASAWPEVRAARAGRRGEG